MFSRDTLSHITITSTFTAEPLERGLLFWLRQFGWQWDMHFAPYNQVFQQLLDPTSIVSQNQAGANLVLIRFEDWFHDDWLHADEPLDEGLHDGLHDGFYGNGTSNQELGQQSPDFSASKPGSPHAPATPSSTVQEFISAITSAAARSTVPYILCFCPPSPETASMYEAEIESWVARIRDDVVSTTNIHVIEWQGIQQRLPVASIHDPQSEKLGRIPYTEDFFIALASTIARKLFVIHQKPYKVIVLDCDNTLWGGVVGEDGSDGIMISPAHRQFQKLLVQQFEAGMLLCLCSKNVEADVLAVFEQRSDMVLQLEHLVAWRVNWQPKSKNIHELAAELELGLDSFIFIDDNPVECAEVQASCPDLLTIPFPKDEAGIVPVVQNIWAFDRLNLTAEDKKRTQLYRENVARNRARGDAPTLGQFLQSLALQISCAPMRRDQLPRISQLTQRTNQFNASTIRRSESEVLTFCAQENADCLAVQVSDRFGDYGLVGTVLYRVAAETLIVDTFLLSCRVLGRGVEHRIIEQLAQIAADHGASQIEIDFLKTPRNEPVYNFLEQIGCDFKTVKGDDATYTLPVYIAQGCSQRLFDTEEAPEVATPEQTATDGSRDVNTTGTDSNTDAESTSATNPNGANTDQIVTTTLLAQIATDYQSVLQIKVAIEAQSRPRPEIAEPYVSPQTDLERAIAAIWAKALGINSIGLNDKFTELGGSSLQIVQVHGQLETITQSTISVMQLFTLPTVKSIADYVDTQQNREQKRSMIQERAQRQLVALQRHRLPRVKVT